MIRDLNTFRQEYKHAQGWWDDLRFPAQRVGVGAQAPTWDTTNLGYVFNDAPPSGNQEIQVIAQLPHTWLEGSMVEVHIHWCLLEDNGDTDETVKWDLLWRWYNVGSTSNGSWTTSQNSIDVSAQSQWISLLSEVGSLAGAGFQISSLLELRLQRDTDDAADDHPHDVLLKEIDLHYQKDQPGSLHEYGKWSITDPTT